MIRGLLFLIFALPLAAGDHSAPSLAGIRRVYIESLGGSPDAIMLKDMIISSITTSRMFVITETAERADAILRGSATDRIYEEEHRSSDTISAGLHGSGSDYTGYRTNRSGSSRSRGLNVSQNESMSSSERRHEASAAVRLVDTAGDVIWSTTQESLGAKFKSSSADVADKICRKLFEDLQKARSSAMQAGIPTR